MPIIEDMNMPDTFRYREVFLKGKPEHGEYDRFRIRHPKMDVGRRAKIFAPFDALRGFGDAICAEGIRVSKEEDDPPAAGDFRLAYDDFE